MIFIRIAPYGTRFRTSTAEIAPFAAHFYDISPYSNSLETDFAEDLTTIYLSIYPAGTGSSAIRLSSAPNRRQ